MAAYLTPTPTAETLALGSKYSKESPRNLSLRFVGNGRPLKTPMRRKLALVGIANRDTLFALAHAVKLTGFDNLRPLSDAVAGTMFLVTGWRDG